MDELSYSSPTNAEMLGVPGKINDKGLTFDVFDRYKPPKATIMALIPIISHNKKMPLWDFYRAEIISRANLSRKDPGIRILNIGFLKGGPVYKDLFIPDLDDIAWKPDDPFDKVQLGIFRKDKDNHFFPLGLFPFDPDLSRKGVTHPIDKFVYQDMIPYKKGGNHRARGNLKGLDKKGTDEKGQN